MPWRWRLAIWIPIYAAGAFGATLAALFVYYAMVWPDPRALGQRDTAPVVVVLARDDTVIAERGTAHADVPLDALPAHVRNAVIATEDERFYRHLGIDPIGILRATLSNLRAGRLHQGGSTITQQLAKNLFLTSERTLERKVEEVLLALWLELRLGKAAILELYLNRVYFGGGAYGIEAAAQRFFGKSARELTLPEAAVIAGLLKAPSRYSPLANPATARARGRVVLTRLADAGFLTAAEAEAAAAISVRFVDQVASRDHQAVAYAVDAVLERLPRLVGVGHTDLVVETTLDARLQRATQAILQDARPANTGTSGAKTDSEAAGEALQAAAVVLGRDGEILALVGGRDYAQSQFNRVTRSRRQPGSAFKPVVYLAALEAGMDPETRVLDAPTTVAGWTPRNDDGLHRGPVDLKRALAQSLNTIAVRLQIELGAARVAEMASRLGIASELHRRPSLALGTSEVTPLELTTAYATIAGGGVAVRPHLVTRVRLSSGRVLYARSATPPRRVLAPIPAAEMTRMLEHVVETGTGRRARLGRHRAAGKTGTTQDYRDAWFAGFTAHATAAVWVGHDDGRPMDKVTGGALPAELWRKIMLVAHEGRPPAPWPVLGSSPDLIAARLPGFAGPRLDAPQPSSPDKRGRIEAEFVRDALARIGD